MVHGLAGITGTLCIVFFANPAAPAGIGGLLTGGGLEHALAEVTGIVVTLGYSFGVTFVIAWVLNRTVGLRAPEQDEDLGLDTAVHAETAYEISLIQLDRTPTTVPAGASAPVLAQAQAPAPSVPDAEAVAPQEPARS